MKAHSIFLFFLLLQIGLFAQDHSAKGFVYDKDSLNALANVDIKVYGTQIKGTSNEKGEFAIAVPEGYNHLIITLENYYTLNYILNDNFQKELNIIYLESVKAKEAVTSPYSPKNDKKYADSIFMNYKNAVSLSLLEMFSIAIAIRYEHFIKPKHSFGLHTSYYVMGRSSMEPYFISDGTSYGAIYTGFKAIPFYRFYPLRSKTTGLFIDAKVPFGYFDFEQFDYYYYYYSSVDEDPSSFWTWGGGLSIGVMTKLPRSKHGVLNFSMGYQYFPMPEPERRTRNNNGVISYYSIDTDWWYERGPGGLFEVKLTIGGIF